MLRGIRLFRVGCSERNENDNNGVTMRFLIESWGPEGQDSHGEMDDLNLAIIKAIRLSQDRPTVEFTVTDTTNWVEMFSCDQSRKANATPNSKEI